MTHVAFILFVLTFSFLCGDCFHPVYTEGLAKSCRPRGWCLSLPPLSPSVPVDCFHTRHMVGIQYNACRHSLELRSISSHLGRGGATVTAPPGAVLIWGNAFRKSRDRVLPQPSQGPKPVPQFTMHAVVWTAKRRWYRKYCNISGSGFLCARNCVVQHGRFDVKRLRLRYKCGRGEGDNPKLVVSALPDKIKINRKGHACEGASCSLCGGTHEKAHELDMSGDVPFIVRFAPSPTGPLHVGGARTALVNYAVVQTRRAQKSRGCSKLVRTYEPNHQGYVNNLADDCCHPRSENDLPEEGDINADRETRFILRIDDTDTRRNIPNAETELLNDLRWLGIKWDEGPDIGGPSSPYRQSERLSIYRDIGNQLLQSGHLYPCFCEKERIESLRLQRNAKGQLPRYDGRCRSLTPREVLEKMDKGRSFVLRFRVPGYPEVVEFNDVLRGRLNFSVAHTCGDFVCFRQSKKQTGVKDGSHNIDYMPIPLGDPVYNFCSAVDDWKMGVSMVIRGEEHLANSVVQILLARALGAPVPLFCHLPIVLADGGGKISKRRCDQRGYTIGALRRRGLHPRAVKTFLLGSRDSVFCVREIGRSSFQYDEDHLLHCQKLTVAEMLRDSNRQPIIEYMRGLLDAAGIHLPDIPSGDCHHSKSSSSLSKEQHIECKDHISPTGEFLVEAAKLLPQYVEPDIVARELRNVLFGHIYFDPSKEQELSSLKGDDWTVYEGVLDAVVATGPCFYDKFKEALTQKGKRCWSISQHYLEMRDKPGLETAHILSRNVFDNWIERVANSLKLKRSVILKAVRTVLTGRSEGPAVVSVVWTYK